MILKYKHLGKKYELESDLVTHFVADQKYVDAHYAGGVAILSVSLLTLLKELKDEFVQVHRAIIVRCELIESVHRDSYFSPATVKLKGVDEHLELARRRFNEIKGIAECNQSRKAQD